MHIDNPIEHIVQDRFGREPIVGLIVDFINALVSTDHSCMIYGIYGKWGEGKTYLMNFVKERLLGQGKDDGIVAFSFIGKGTMKSTVASTSRARVDSKPEISLMVYPSLLV